MVPHCAHKGAHRSRRSFLAAEELLRRRLSHATGAWCRIAAPKAPTVPPQFPGGGRAPAAPPKPCHWRMVPHCAHKGAHRSRRSFLAAEELLRRRLSHATGAWCRIAAPKAPTVPPQFPGGGRAPAAPPKPCHWRMVPHCAHKGAHRTAAVSWRRKSSCGAAAFPYCLLPTPYCLLPNSGGGTGAAFLRVVVAWQVRLIRGVRGRQPSVLWRSSCGNASWKARA